MAIRVQTSADINFGTFGAAASVTHLRVRPVIAGQQAARGFVVPLSQTVNVQSGRPFIVASGDLDIVYPSGALPDTHIQAAVSPLWASVAWQMDAMTDNSTVVSVSGYSQQTHDAWAISTEAD